MSAAPQTPDRCPHCHTPVISAPGLLLEAEPHPLGIHRADGAPMTRAEVLRAWSAKQPAGRRRHACDRPEQGELFAIPVGTDKARGGRR